MAQVGSGDATEQVSVWVNLTERFTAWAQLWALLIRATSAPLLIGAVLFNLLLGVLPLGFMVLLGRVLFLLPDASRDSSGEVLTVLAFAVGVLVVQQAIAPFQGPLVEMMGRRVDEHCLERLTAASLSDAPTTVLEEPESLDLLADCRGAYSRWGYTSGDAAAALIPLLARYVQLTTAVVLTIVLVHPLIGVVVGATALLVRFGVRGTLGKYALLHNSLGEHRRRMTYLRDLLTSAVVTKEIRLLGILPWLRARLESDTMAHLIPRWAGSRKLQFWPFIGLSGVGLIGGAVAFSLVAWQAASGALNLFQLALALQVVMIPLRFGVYFPECDVQTQYGRYTFGFLTRFEELVAQRRKPVSGSATGVIPTGDCTIRFENVSFRYSPNSPWVLRNLDLEIEAGRSTAVVGLNGAGKTTLVKLLARLYDPTEGRITVGGVDLQHVDSATWQRELAVIFQDYVRYDLPLADNVAFGAPHLASDEDAVRSALVTAGAGDLLDSMPAGLDTVLSAKYDGGRDLSGGQWQRIALARAILAVTGGAHVLVLDEPTAQLDVRAEAEFFDRFLSADGAIPGTTSIVISHRFSTVRRADRIVVIEHGRVIEQGNHAELVAARGRYAQMFELQAQRFVTGTVSA